MKPKNKQTRETLIFISYPSPLKKQYQQNIVQNKPQIQNQTKKTPQKTSTITTTQILDFSDKVTMYIYRTNKYIYTH